MWQSVYDQTSDKGTISSNFEFQLSSPWLCWSSWSRIREYFIRVESMFSVDSKMEKSAMRKLILHTHRINLSLCGYGRLKVASQTQLSSTTLL
ncbi:hypothetical protein L5515_007595 [Caenorhabditis briggsae]|uniref:Uncharacterized protein n=1 Tax=Caenorhabditis briggsae TaxID=6238 RepID=A0AAE9F2B6_CAEBR|nr:hypothetical protein L3Y34_007757 [Caenorhabditis briggsae]UMM34587.1 hypothetical protein L5515_007595 [Caenorhabditis briggsae]